MLKNEEMKKQRVNLIITSYNEPKTVKRLIESFENQAIGFEEYDFSILLVCPDKKTAEAGLKADKLGIVRWLKDEGRGKPAALNLAFERLGICHRLASRRSGLVPSDGFGQRLDLQALDGTSSVDATPLFNTGEIIVFTDGDVEIEEKAIVELLNCYIAENTKNDEKTGAVSGHPVPMNSKDNIFGYWAHLLTEMAHRWRAKASKSGGYLDGSGYLYAISGGLVDKIPENVLADDAYISQKIWQKGFKIAYAPEAKVFVKYPDNFKDWLKQKKRSAGGHVQNSKFKNQNVKLEEMRTFRMEAQGIWEVLLYPKTLKELWWTALLVFARVYLWLAVFWERKIVKKDFKKTWVRVESTK